MGNTCFLNSVIQCLTYCPSFAQACLLREHSSQCRKPSNSCIACVMESHIVQYLSPESRSNGSVKPIGVLTNIKRISKTIAIGRQEDAHEFLRFLIDSMLYPKKNGHDTSVAAKYFKGCVVSTITCSSCQKRSDKVDMMLDVSLDIKSSKSIEHSLGAFVGTEVLKGANKYACETCKRLTDAKKQVTFKESPSTLTLHLKRFGFSKQTSKLNHFVQYGETLDLGPYMSNKTATNETYELCGGSL